MTNGKFPPLKPKVVLGVAAHPDDLDFGTSGTMAAFAQAGAAVYYLILTDGSLGSDDVAMTGEKLRRIRRREQLEAAHILGVKDVFFSNYPDGNLANTENVKRDIVRIIRQTKPDVVITMDPSFLYSASRGFINHPDHRAAGQATLDAVYPLARDHLAYPDLLSEGFKPHKTPTVLLTNFERSNFAIDVTDTIKLKFDALAKHQSQVPKDLSALRRRFMAFAAAAGQAYGYRYAESFIRIDIV